MKKTLTLVAALCTFLTFNVKAQLPDGSIAPDFTLKDINGTTHNLYTYLNAGKTVYLDFSATWCSPCWSVHNRRALDTLYRLHGPIGQTGVSSSSTNDVMVIFIEGDDNTNGGCIINSGCNTSYAPTQGNWALNTDYPICDSGEVVMNAYQNGYFPTVYMICPDRGTHCFQTTQTGTSTYMSAADLYAARATAPCPVASASLDASLSNGSAQNSLSICDSSAVTVNLTNESTVPLTSATITFKVNGVTQKVVNWTGNLATYNYTPVTTKILGPIGSNLITAVVSSPNGGTDAVSSNNTNAYTIANAAMSAVTTPTVTEGFQSTFPPANWGVVNGGDQLYKWVSSAHGGYQASNKCAYIDLWDTPSGDRDEMVLQTVDMSAFTAANLSFDIAKAGITNQADELRVRVSTDCGNTWTTVYDKYDYATTNPLQTVTSNNAWSPTAASQWRTDVINMNSYAGNPSVIIKFQTISGYSNNLYIDNINLATPAGVREINNISNVRLFPNPTTSLTTIEVSLAKQDNVTISVYNTMGQIVLSQQHNNVPAGDNAFTLNTENLTSGIYNVVTTSKQGVNTQKLSVSK